MISNSYLTYRYTFAKRLEQQPIEYSLVLKVHQFVAIHSHSFMSVKSDYVTWIGQNVAVSKQYSLRVTSERGINTPKEYDLILRGMHGLKRILQ